METPIPNLAAVQRARAALAGRIHHTPILSSTTAAARVAALSGIELAEGRLYLKAEHLQKTGSFKPRGALTRIASLTSEERRRGAITLSAGNAGQAYAWAGRQAGVPVTVVMPAGAVRSKVNACLEYGAEVVLHGAHVGEALARLEEIRAARGLTYVHPYDQPEVVAGNGSLGLEVLADVPEVDVVVVAVGGGGLISGVAIAVKESRPAVRVYGVEPEGSDALNRAVRAGQPVPLQPRSVADGLGAPIAGRIATEVGRRYLDGVILIDDPTILAGLRFAVERLKQVLEPAGATALAALLAGGVPLRHGDRVLAVLSGGNVEVGRLGELLAAAQST
ncbi:MAG: pyridoxal-phosphate dependent enzyme [Chloroflexota bacterium]|nr:pyridoxal-phosphate dependent enzyme [Chloroflexota bacterium]